MGDENHSFIQNGEKSDAGQEGRFVVERAETLFLERIDDVDQQRRHIRAR